LISSYRDLDFYKDSYELALEIHRLTLTFPSFEKLELGSQMRRASKGIPQNIAEGWGRRSSEKDFKHFLVIALGSSDEMQVHLDFTRDLGYITVEAHSALRERYSSVSRRINAFHGRWQRF
jgi:four helix bundle protein